MEMYHSILGIDKDSSIDDIKKAFRMKTLDDNDNFDSLLKAYNEILNNISNEANSSNNTNSNYLNNVNFDKF